MDRNHRQITVTPIAGRPHRAGLHKTIDVTTDAIRATENAKQTRAKACRRRTRAGTVINITMIAAPGLDGGMGPDASSRSPDRRTSALTISIAPGAKVSVARPSRRSNASLTKAVPSNVASPTS